MTGTTVACEPGRGFVRARVAGDLDIAAAPLLRDTLNELAQGNVPVLLDLSAAPFIDSLGLSVLVTAAKRFRQEGVPMLLVAPQPRTRELVEVTGLAGVLRLFASEADAVAEVRTEAGA